MHELIHQYFGDTVSPPTVWNDAYGATGSGVSTVFRRPFFQFSDRGVIGAGRGMPDVSLSAAVDGGAWASSGWVRDRQDKWVLIDVPPSQT